MRPAHRELLRVLIEHGDRFGVGRVPAAQLLDAPRIGV